MDILSLHLKVTLQSTSLGKFTVMNTGTLVLGEVIGIYFVLSLKEESDWNQAQVFSFPTKDFALQTMQIPLLDGKSICGMEQDGTIRDSVIVELRHC
jgi:hypothetical protein